VQALFKGWLLFLPQVFWGLQDWELQVFFIDFCSLLFFIIKICLQPVDFF